MKGSTESYSLGDGRHAPTLAQGRKPSLRAAVDARYSDIHFITVRQLHRERHLSIPPTVLVHEAYFRLFEFAPKRNRAVTLSDTNLCDSDAVYDALDVDTPHSDLHEVDAVAAEVASRRVFSGLCIEEAAAVPRLSEATASRR